MISTYQIDAIDGDHLIPYTSHAMDRLVSISYHQTPTAGTISIMARPFGRTEFMQVQGAQSLDLTQEHSASIAYPLAEIKMAISGVAGGSVINICIADGA